MRIYVAGHRGMVGGAILRQLQGEGHDLITATSAELDLTDQVAVRDFMQAQKPDAVILAAAKVGGTRINHLIPDQDPVSGLAAGGHHYGTKSPG